jgi:hypothetical protein
VGAFANAFHSFRTSHVILKELGVSFDKNISSFAALATSENGASKKELVKVVFTRELLLMKRNMSSNMVNAANVSFLADTIKLLLFKKAKLLRV